VNELEEMTKIMNDHSNFVIKTYFYGSEAMDRECTDEYTLFTKFLISEIIDDIVKAVRQDMPHTMSKSDFASLHVQAMKAQIAAIERSKVIASLMTGTEQ